MDRNVICIRQSVCGQEYTEDRIKGGSSYTKDLQFLKELRNSKRTLLYGLIPSIKYYSRDIKYWTSILFAHGYQSA